MSANEGLLPSSALMAIPWDQTEQTTPVVASADPLRGDPQSPEVQRLIAMLHATLFRVAFDEVDDGDTKLW